MSTNATPNPDALALSRLSLAVEALSDDLSPLAVAGNLAAELEWTLNLDGAAILWIRADHVQTIASSGALQWRFRQGHDVSPDLARVVLEHAPRRPWIEPGDALSLRSPAVGLAIVPCLIGASSIEHGCIVFGQQPGTPAGLADRLPTYVAAAAIVAARLRVLPSGSADPGADGGAAPL